MLDREKAALGPGQRLWGPGLGSGKQLGRAWRRRKGDTPSAPLSLVPGPSPGSPLPSCANGQVGNSFPECPLLHLENWDRDLPWGGAGILARRTGPTAPWRGGGARSSGRGAHKAGSRQDRHLSVPQMHLLRPFLLHHSPPRVLAQVQEHQPDTPLCASRRGGGSQLNLILQLYSELISDFPEHPIGGHGVGGTLGGLWNRARIRAAAAHGRPERVQVLRGGARPGVWGSPGSACSGRRCPVTTQRGCNSRSWELGAGFRSQPRSHRRVARGTASLDPNCPICQ